MKSRTDSNGVTEYLSFFSLLQRAYSVCIQEQSLYFSGPARLGKGRGLNYDDWLNRKKAAEQKIIDVKKSEIEKKKLEEEERLVSVGYSSGPRTNTRLFIAFIVNFKRLKTQ